MACGIAFPDQGLNSGPCIGSVESEPLDHQRSPDRFFFFFFCEEHVLKLTLVKSAQLCKYAKTHGIVQITWMDCIVCEFYLNSLLKKNIYIYIYIEREREYLLCAR